VSGDDLIDGLLGLGAGSPLAALRRRRPEALRHAEGAHRELLTPEDPGNVSPTERAALALRVALREGEWDLAATFRAMLAGEDEALMLAEDLTGAPMEGRPATLLRYADTVAATPEAVTQATIDALSAMGLDARDVVAVTQLVAFVPYQVRLLAGLRAMLGRDGAADAPRQAPAKGPFTMEEVGWAPRVPPVEAATATPAQLAALEACPPAQRRSTYFLTLANDPGSLGERGALFNTVMYAPRGLPRAEREFATAVTSMANGCVYCTAVHARRFADLSKRRDAMQRALRDGFGVETDPRLRAIGAFSEALTLSPGAVGAPDVAALRAAGLDDLELLDLIHAVAMFANANRLMQSLGESTPPA